MERRSSLAAGLGAPAGAAAGCLGDPEPSRLDLAVRNDGDAPVDVDVVRTGECAEPP
ncbi:MULTISPECIES: hypothetical protein [Halorubrum]|uniref:hypothetical protein n=1 Tax=Halorubrum TaxID=56688 RepID=UPI000ABF5030|nr:MULTISPECIES: hypothetical protein [Halorubrum]